MLLKYYKRAAAGGPTTLYRYAALIKIENIKQVRILKINKT